jgi:release factor glutamine methyltransferase
LRSARITDGTEARLVELLDSQREARWILDAGRRLVADGGEPPRTDDATDERADSLAWTLGLRRAGGEPLQYVLGRWPFRGIELRVDRRALIPRPETEELVDVAVGELDRMVHRRPAPRVVDLGTGSGAIALSLATELAGRCPHASLWAVDDDPVALSLARENLHDVRKQTRGAALLPVELVEGCWWARLPARLRGGVALAVANPPYVAPGEWETLDPVVRDHEPAHALVAPDGPDGTPGVAAVLRIVDEAPGWLDRPASLVVELAPAQAQVARRAALAAGFDEAEVRRDLAGRSRFLVARLRQR